MIGSLPARPLLTGLLILAWLGATSPSTANAQAAQAPAAQEPTPGQFFLIEEPIDSEVLERIKASTKQLLARALAQKTPAPILVFEFRPGRAQPGSSGFGTSFELANYLSTELAGAKLTVAYVPQPLKGYAVLPAAGLRRAGHGPGRHDRADHPRGRGREGRLPRAGQDPRPPQGEGPDLFAGLLDRDADLKLVRTADRQAHYLLPENLEAFRKANPVADADIQPAWEGGSRGVLTSGRAREEGIAKLRADDRAEIANVYRIIGRGPCPTTRPCSRSPGRSGSPSKGGSTRSRRPTSAVGSSRPGARGSTSSSSRSTARGA